MEATPKKSRLRGKWLPPKFKPRRAFFPLGLTPLKRVAEARLWAFVSTNSYVSKRERVHLTLSHPPSAIAAPRMSGEADSQMQAPGARATPCGRKKLSSLAKKILAGEGREVATSTPPPPGSTSLLRFSDIFVLFATFLAVSNTESNLAQ